MRKIIAVISSVVLLGAVVYFLIDNEDHSDSSYEARIQTGRTVGDSSAINKIYMLSPVDSSEKLDAEREKFANFLDGLTRGLKDYISSKDINLEIISFSKLRNILATETDFKGRVLVVPEGIDLQEDLRSSLHEKALTTILYSAEDGRTCVAGNQSPYLWNFGITTSMYAEGYLSYAFQRFSLLAKDLSLVVYSNTKPTSSREANYLKDTAKGLGFNVIASVSVDEREADLYKVLREIVNFAPQIILATPSNLGTAPLIQQSHKLGFGFEMAMMLSETSSEEELSKLGTMTNKYIKPSVYIDTFKSESMKSFKEENKTSITASYYKGYLLSETLVRILLQFKKENQPINFSRSLMALDGVSVSGPSGQVMVHGKARGLIQPLHVGEFKDGIFSYLQYLGDMSPAERCEEGEGK